MLSIKIWGALIFFLTCIQLGAQNLTKEMIESALENNEYERAIPGLCKDYPNSRYIMPTKEIDFTFEYNEETKKVEVIRKEEIKYFTYNTKVNQYKNFTNLITKDLNTDILYVRKGDVSNPDIVLSYSDLEIGSIFYHDIKAARVTQTVGRWKDNYGYYQGSSKRSLFIGKKIKDVRYLTREFFVDQLPILKQTITFEIPDWLDITIKEYNTENIQFERTESKENGAKKVTFIGYALDGYTRERSTEEGSFIYPHLLVIPNSFSKGGKQKLFGDVDGLYAWYRGLVNQIEQDPSVFKELVSSLVEGKTSDIEKIKAIYYWIQDNIRYVAYEDGIAGFKPEACDGVYLKKYGDCKGMANLMKAMLTSLGYDARLTWLGTNSVPYSYEEPCLASDNHMICTLYLNGKKYYLDGTEKNVAFGDNAQRIQGRQVLIEDDEKYELATIPVTSDINKVIRKYNVTVYEDKLVGNVKLGYEGEGKRYFLNVVQSLRSEYKEKALQNLITSGSDGVVSTKIETSDLNDRESNVSLTSNIEISYLVQALDKSKAVYLDLFDNDIGTSEIDTARKFAYNIGIKGDYITEMNVKAKNPKLSAEHKSFEVKTDDFIYNVNFKALKSSVKVTKTVKILNPTIQVQNIPDWNKAVQQMKGAINKVILFN